jgi:hypothetical protein
VFNCFAFIVAADASALLPVALQNGIMPVRATTLQIYNKKMRNCLK